MRYVVRHPERGRYVKYWSNLSLGDVVQVDWVGTVGKPTHTTVVTGLVFSGSSLADIKFSYHTNNRTDKLLISAEGRQSKRNMVGVSPQRKLLRRYERLEA